MEIALLSNKKPKPKSGMVKLWHTPTKSKSVDLLKYLTVGFIVFFITTQPMVEILFNLVETEYEICETYDEDEIEKKEELKEKKANENKFYNPSLISSSESFNLLFSIIKTCSHSKTDDYFIEYHLEVPYPPPQLS